ncbi:MAG: hypothetical protein ACJ72L_21180 [Marmoricola sp.]
MAQVNKVVRFYRPYLIDEKDRSKPFADEFWKEFRKGVEKLTAKQRRARHNGDEYRGESGLGTSPATRYFRVGRVRTPIDWPDTVDTNDNVAPLSLSNRNLLENAYLVPFGAKNQVAIMNPIQGMVTISAMEAWIGQMLKLPEKGHAIELRPEIDHNVLKKLSNAVGVASLSVRIPHDADLQLPEGKGSVVENAISGAQAAGQDLLDVELRFSFGSRKPTGGLGKTLQATAERLAKAVGPDKIDVSMILEKGDGLKREQHSLLRDQIASSANFSGDSGHQFTVDEILNAMEGAIKDYRTR